MRIIDADALKAEFDKNCAMECACCDHATCNHVRNAVGCGLMDAAPTIDAIPVEWFKNRRDIYLKAYHAGHESELHVATILNDTLKAWQKEQEAHGT